MLTQLRPSRTFLLRLARNFSQEAAAAAAATTDATTKKSRHTKSEDANISDPKNVFLAIDLLRKFSWAKFDETVEIAVQLGVDPRKPNQAIKVCATRAE